MAKRSKQYSFHLNLNNPDHLKIYRTLEDLNTDIHKSVSNFVIKAVIQYINDASRSSLTKSGKNEKENLEGYVTRQELSEAKLQIKADVMKEVAQLFGNAAIHVFIKQTSIDWAKLISKAKLYDKEIEVYHTLWYTEHIYPGTIPNSVFSMFELKDYDFVDEYNVKDNSHERIKWKLDFYHRLFNVERRKEALEAAKDESEKLKKMITDLRD